MSKRILLNLNKTNVYYGHASYQRGIRSQTPYNKISPLSQSTCVRVEMFNMESSSNQQEPASCECHDATTNGPHPRAWSGNDQRARRTVCRLRASKLLSILL